MKRVHVYTSDNQVKNILTKSLRQRIDLKLVSDLHS